MATGKEGKPEKKGTPDNLLEELKVAASKPNPPAEVPPRDTDKADSGISTESIKSEREEDTLIDKNIEARRAAEAETAEPKIIPPELEHLGKDEQESYLTHVAEVRADKEKKEKMSKKKKPVKPRTQKPKDQSEPVKPLTPMPPEFYEPRPKPDYIDEQLAAMVAKKSETARSAAEESMPAVSRSNRGRLEKSESGAISEPTKVEKEKREFSLAEVEDIAREQLKGQAEITQLDITETPEGLQLHAELDAGMMGGKIVLNGLIANAGETIAVQGLDIKARGYVKSMIESNLSGFDTAIKNHFERQYGKPVSSIQVGESGLTVEFESSPVESSDEKVVANPEDAPENVKEAETSEKPTAGESHILLGKLIEGYKKTLEGAQKIKEKFEGKSFKESMSYMGGRIKELDARSAELSEKYFGKLGEKYNKLPIWQKIALGSTLAMGLGLSSSWVAGAYGAALFSTRFAAMAGSFKNNQNLLESINKGEASGWLANTRLYKWLGSGSSEKSRNNTAMAKALVTSFGMTAALGVAAKELSDYHVADRIGSWIGEHVYNWTHADTGAEAVGAGVSESVPLSGAKVSVGTEVPPPPVAAATASGVHGFQAEVRHADFAAEQSPATGFQAEVRAVDNATTAEAPRATGFQAEVRAIDNATAAEAPRTTGFQSEVRAVDNATAIEAPKVTGFQAEVRAVDNAIPEPKTTGFQADVRRVDIGLEKAAGEAAVPASAIELPSVQARAGDGYERMLQHLWEQSKGLDPEKFPEGSDIRRLIEANPKSITAEIHRLATDNEFFKANGENVRINIGDKLAVDANGDIWLGEDILAPEGAPVTAPFHPDVPAAPPAGTPSIASEGIQASATVETSASAEISSTPPLEKVDMGDVPKPIKTITAPEYQNTTTALDHDATPPEAPSIPETSTHPALGEVNPNFKVNALGLPVDTAHAETYFTPKGDVVIFGGSLSPEAMAEKVTDIVSKDHSAVVYYETTRPGEHWWQGTVTQINRASWVERSGSFMPVDEEGPIAGATTGIQVGQVEIANDMTAPELKRVAPGIDDLKELYKPGVRKP